MSDNYYIDDINKQFRELIQSINAIDDEITNLDALRIQQVYNYTQNTTGEIDVTEFITTCWSKLSVYHGVYCNLGAGNYFKLNSETINNGDFLIKLPNNKFLRIPGSTPYYYQPTSYTNGQLSFSLTTSGVTPIGIDMPTWAQGNQYGHIFDWETTTPASAITYGSSITLTTIAVVGGRYFIQDEEIVFAPKDIRFDYSSHTITLPTGVTSCYIPYIQ